MIFTQLYKRILSSIVLIPVVFFFIVKGSIIFNFFISLIFCLSFYEWFKMSKNRNYLYPGFLFLFFSFLSTYLIRSSFGVDSLFIFIFIISICISTDIGGYIFGNIFKGPKLTKISPNKTYSGVLGSYLLVLITTYSLVSYSDLMTKNDFFFNKYIIIISILISTSSQLGDIFVSYFKRLSNIKDTSNLIPGHGGILDRIDGMIFAFPFFYILNLFYKF